MRLIEYLCKVNVIESITCQCGKIEIVKHHLLHCPLFQEGGEVMRKRLFEICGIIHLDLNILLDATKKRRCVLLPEWTELPEWTLICGFEYFLFTLLEQCGLEFPEKAISLRNMLIRYQIRAVA